jgi:zinc protease
MGLQMTTLAPLAPPVRSALMDLLVDPFIDDAIVEREKLYVLEQQRKRDDNPAQQSILQFMRALFGSHPYARDPLGQPETIRSLKAGDLTGFLGTHGVAGALRVVVAGDVDPAEWRQFLTERLKDRPGGLRTLRTLSWAPPEKKQILFSPSDKEQSHVILGYAGLTYNDEAKYALEVATSVLSGQGGRLFIELRDKASLAYSVAPLRMEGIEAGYFGGYIACSPEKTDRAIAMMKAEFEKLATNELTAEELGRAQRYLIGRHDIELQRASAVGAGLFFDLLYDSPRLELFEYAQRIWAVTPAAVREVCQRIFSRPETISVVGQREPAIKGA